MGVIYDEKSCGVIIFRKQNSENFYLILHYPGGHFDFPKGHVEANEEEMETAARELEEETGITDVQFIPGYREEMSYKYFRSGKPSNKQVVYFLAETKTEKITISHEHTGSIWLPYDEAMKKLTFANAQNLLEKAKHFLTHSL